MSSLFKKASSGVDRSSTLTLAIAGAQEAALQFSKKDNSSRTVVQDNLPYKTDTSYEETEHAESYNLRPMGSPRGKDKTSSTNFSVTFDNGTLPLHHEDKRYKLHKGGVRDNQYRGADERRSFQQPAKVSILTFGNFGWCIGILHVLNSVISMWNLSRDLWHQRRRTKVEVKGMKEAVDKLHFLVQQ